MTSSTLCLFDILCCSVPPGDNDDEVSTERNMAAVSPIPKIVTTPVKEDFSKEEEDSRDEWGKSEEFNITNVPRANGNAVSRI